MSKLIRTVEQIEAELAALDKEFDEIDDKTGIWGAAQMKSELLVRMQAVRAELELAKARCQLCGTIHDGPCYKWLRPGLSSE